MSQQYPSDWDTRRKEVYERDNYTCQNCGARGGPHGDAELHAHHVVPKSKGGTHRKSNLKTVCKDCHNAIHGNSMAPSAGGGRTVTESERETEFPLDVHEYPYAVANQIDCANLVAKIYEQFEAVAESFDDLGEYADMYASVDDDEIPERLTDRYGAAMEDVEAELDELSGQLDQFEDISETEFASESRDRYDEFIDQLETALLRLDEYRSSLTDIVESQRVADSEFVDLRLLQEETEEAIESVAETGNELLQALSSEVSSEVATQKRDTTLPATVAPFDDCPVCGATDSIQVFSETALARCPDCRTEFEKDGFSWAVTHSSRDIVGYSMAAIVWKKVGERGFSDPAELDRYVSESRTFVSRVKYSIAGGIAFQVLALLWAVSTGNFVGLFLLIVVSVVGIGGFVWLLQRRVKQS